MERTKMEMTEIKRVEEMKISMMIMGWQNKVINMETPESYSFGLDCHFIPCDIWQSYLIYES